MAEALTIEVQPRDSQKNKGTGTRVARRLRAQGRVPAILYGHKQDPVPISLSNEDVAVMLKRQVHLTQLQWDGATELAVVRDVQWDYLGKNIIHLDFLRVSAGETVESEVALEVHGTPVGLGEGGRLEQIVRSLTIKAKPTEIPKLITIEVGHLHVNQSIHVRELALPPGVSTDVDPDQLLVHVVEKKAGAAAEPTVEGEGEAEGGEQGEKPEGEQESE